jgi:hypothetical protein
MRNSTKFGGQPLGRVADDFFIGRQLLVRAHVHEVPMLAVVVQILHLGIHHVGALH